MQYAIMKAFCVH